MRKMSPTRSKANTFQSDIFLPNPSGGIIHANTQTVFNQPPVFEVIKIQRKLVEYAGPEAKILPYRDFLAPKTAESLDSANCLVYEYDLPAIKKSSAIHRPRPESADSTNPGVSAGYGVSCRCRRVSNAVTHGSESPTFRPRRNDGLNPDG